MILKSTLGNLSKHHVTAGFIASSGLFFAAHANAQVAAEDPEAMDVPVEAEPVAAEPAEPVAATTAAAAPAPAEEPPVEAESKEQANNTLYLELLGPGLLYSVNYERRISDFNLRLGVGGASWGGSGYLSVPVGFNYMGIGSDKHHLELGATATIFYVAGGGDSAAAVAFSPIVGYRLQPQDGGFNLRAGVSPIIGAAGEGVVSAGFLPWPYVSFGASF